MSRQSKQQAITCGDIVVSIAAVVNLRRNMLIHGFVRGSRVNGPGLRAVVYFQGCTLGCRSCWNAESHPFIGEEWSIVT